MKNLPLPSTLLAKLKSLINWVWRELGAHAAFLGFLLTLITAALDWTGHLQPIERIFYNNRVRYFQFFTKPPTDRLVQLDIDDTALETIGRWPWPRTKLAEIIDELRLSGATELSLDILLVDPQEPTATRAPDGSIDVVDHDANLAAVLKRFGKVLVPVSFSSFGTSSSETPEFRAIVRALRADLELTPEETAAPGSAPPGESDFLYARREAMSQRFQELLARPGEHSVEQLRKKLLPRLDRAPPGSSIQREFDTQYQIALSENEISRLALKPPDPLLGNVILTAGEAMPMTYPFAKVATSSGFVNYVTRQSDNTVDAVPLCISYRDQIYPQMDLALACAVLNVDPRTLTFGRNQILMPRKDGSQAIIPLHPFRTDVHGNVDMFMDIPWYGGHDWKNMYDYPRYGKAKQQMIITLPWAVAEARKRLQKTNEEADKAVGFFADAGLDSAKAYVKTVPGPDQINARLAAWKTVIEEATPSAQQAQSIPENQRNADDKVFFQAFDALNSALKEMTTDWPELQQKAAELHTALNGKAVLIGGTSTALGDQQPTPLQADCPGAVIHGFIFNSIYSAYFWRTAPQWVTLLITFAVGWITRLIVSHNHALRALILTSLLSLAYLLINCLVLFDHQKWIIGLAGPMLAIALVWGSGTLIRFIAESQERSRITKRFQSYIDPKIVQYVLDHPELERLHGEVREMTVCFTDLAGFTTFTERLREKAVEVLGRYIDKMVSPIRDNGGLIHHRMGDGIMFSFNAPIPNPNMAVGAVSAVLDMHAALTLFNEELVAEGYPRLVMRAGVNTGLAVVGDSGSEDATEYACLGDTTNLAARLEGANTATGTRSLISGRTVELLHGEFLLRPIARLVVKGKSEGVMTYEPMSRIESATDEQKRLAEMTTAMFDAYIAANFTACITTADKLDEAFGPAALTKLYRELSKKYLAEPPVDFKGYVVLTDKG